MIQNSNFQSDLEEALTTAGLYYFYGAWAAVAFLYCLLVIPETRGKSAKQMKRMFSKEEKVVVVGQEEEKVEAKEM